MSISSTIAKIQSLLAGAGLVKTAFTDRFPARVNPSDLPASVVFPMRATWEHQAVGYNRATRTYKVQILVRPVAQGVAWDDGYGACIQILESAGALFLSHLDLDQTVDHIAQITDNGIELITLGGMEFWVINLLLTCVEKG